MPVNFYNRRWRLLALLLWALSPWVQADTVEVKLEGVEGDLADNVRAFLSITEETEDGLTPTQIKRRHRRASGEIQSALQPFGYYQPVIQAQLQQDGEAWAARYQIEPGPVTMVSALQMRIAGPGANEERLKQVLARSQLAEGQQLLHRRYTATKTALLQTAYDVGYLDAAYESAAIRVYPEQTRAEIDLVLDTGPRYYFGEISLQQEVLNDAFLRRYLTFERGDRFRTDLLADLQLALSDTGYFSQVEIEAQREKILTRGSSDRYPQLPVVVRGKPSKPQKYTVSAGFGTDTGPRVGLGVELRRINRRGHQFRSDLRLSAVKQELSARYTIPVDDVLRDELAFGAALKNEEFGDLTSETVRLSGVRVDGRKNGDRRYYLNLERENFDDGDGSGERTSYLLYPGVTLTFQKADDPLRTRRGVSLSLDLHGGSEAVVSETDFVQALLTGASVLPLGEDFRLLLRGQLGATEVEDFAALPPSQRFFTGGDRSVRGYGYQEISPENAVGDDIGGQYLAEGSVELEYLFYGDFGAAVFFDAGDAANDTSLFDFQRGVGIGGRWRSPIGSVRLDLAHPLDDPDSDFRIHFSLGPDL